MSCPRSGPRMARWGCTVGKRGEGQFPSENMQVHKKNIKCVGGSEKYAIVVCSTMQFITKRFESAHPH